MHSSSLLLLLGAAIIVAVLHSILPDHWVPLAVVARTQRWSLLHVGRVTFLASLGHVLTSLVLGGILALIGLQFQQELETQQGHIVGAVLVLTGVIFLLWGWVGHGSHRHHHGESHTHDHSHDQEQTHDDTTVKERSGARRFAAIVVPFGVAASPDFTILPVAFAASALGRGAVVGVLSVFAVFTIVTFVGLTVIATIAGYQIKGEWLENNASTITALVLIAIGVVAFIGF